MAQFGAHSHGEVLEPGQVEVLSARRLGSALQGMQPGEADVAALVAHARSVLAPAGGMVRLLVWDGGGQLAREVA